MKNMLVSAILWVLMGSAILWVVLFDILAFSWVFALVKKLVWGKKSKVNKTTKPTTEIDA